MADPMTFTKSNGKVDIAWPVGATETTVSRALLDQWVVTHNDLVDAKAEIVRLRRELTARGLAHVAQPPAGAQ